MVGASKIARDITAQREFELERERLLEREQQLRLDAEKANRIKNEFLATLSTSCERRLWRFPVGRKFFKLELTIKRPSGVPPDNYTKIPISKLS